MLLLWVLFLYGFSQVHGCLRHMQVLHQWKYIEYEFESEELKREILATEDYDPAANVMLDTDRAADGRQFITIWGRPGVLASVCTVSENSGDGGPLARPYPNWNWYNKSNDCNNKIINVFRVAIDNCNHLWILDTGVSGTTDRICPAKLLRFDLSTDKLVDRIVIPESLTKSNDQDGLLITPIVISRGRNCQQSVVLMADVVRAVMLVYDSRSRGLKALTSPAFDRDDKYTNFTINDTSFQLTDTLFGMTSDGNSVYFRPITSLSLYKTDLKTILESKDTLKKYKSYLNIFRHQATVLAAAGGQAGKLFIGLTTETAIAAWYEKQKNDVIIVEQDPVALQFISGMKVKGELLYAVSNHFQDFATGNVNLKQVNFRVVVGFVKDLLIEAQLDDGSKASHEDSKDSGKSGSNESGSHSRNGRSDGDDDDDDENSNGDNSGTPDESNGSHDDGDGSNASGGKSGEEGSDGSKNESGNNEGSGENSGGVSGGLSGEGGSKGSSGEDPSGNVSAGGSDGKGDSGESGNASGDPEGSEDHSGGASGGQSAGGGKGSGEGSTGDSEENTGSGTGSHEPGEDGGVDGSGCAKDDGSTGEGDLGSGNTKESGEGKQSGSKEDDSNESNGSSNKSDDSSKPDSS